MNAKYFLTLLVAIVFCSCQEVVDKPLEDDLIINTDPITIGDSVSDTANTTISQANSEKAKTILLVLDSEVGKWDCEIEYQSTYNGKPEKFKAEAISKMVMDGRFQETDFKHLNTNIPFEAKTLIGHDDKSGETFMTFFDNRGTGLLRGKGNYETLNNKFIFKGEKTDFITNSILKYREEHIHLDKNNKRITQHLTDPDGHEFKSLQIIMTRKK